MKFFETLLNAIKTMIVSHSYSKAESDAKYGGKPDWKQNDENANDYIKNRPFYECQKLQDILESTTVSVEYEYANLPRLNQTLQPGKLYVVTFNGTKYECVAWAGEYGGILGNGAIYGGSETDGNGEPFCIDSSDYDCYLNVRESGEYTVSIATYVDSVEKIPFKFLPELNNIGKEGTAKGAEIFNDYEDNIASGTNSHAEGSNTTASNSDAHAEGHGTVASAQYSHAEGHITTASGSSSHAEGSWSIADGHAAHAEGYETKAMKGSSHSEGYYTEALGYYSHAQGEYTVANNRTQHVQGAYNIIDETGDDQTQGRYVHIVGNGTSKARSNAHTLDWSGNAWFAGDIRVGGTSYDDAVSLLPKRTTVELLDSGWTGNASPYSQTVIMNGVTVNSKIDLQLTASQIIDFQNSDTMFVTENNDGVVTVYAIGNKPKSTYYIQALITEVMSV